MDQMDHSWCLTKWIAETMDERDLEESTSSFKDLLVASC